MTVKLDERLLAAAVVCEESTPGYSAQVHNLRLSWKRENYICEKWEERGWLNGIGSTAAHSWPTPEGLRALRALAATLGPVQVDAYAPKPGPASEEPWMAATRDAVRSALGDAFAEAMWNGSP